MNPYEIAATTTVTECLAHWGTSCFADKFLSELTRNGDDLPLTDMCLNGGNPSPKHWPDLNDLEIEGENHGLVKGSLSVAFTEELLTSCSGVTFSDKRTGRINFLLNLETGEVQYEPPRLKREYEPDEF